MVSTSRVINESLEASECGFWSWIRRRISVVSLEGISLLKNMGWHETHCQNNFMTICESECESEKSECFPARSEWPRDVTFFEQSAIQIPAISAEMIVWRRTKVQLWDSVLCKVSNVPIPILSDVSIRHVLVLRFIHTVWKPQMILYRKGNPYGNKRLKLVGSMPPRSSLPLLLIVELLTPVSIRSCLVPEWPSKSSSVETESASALHKVLHEEVPPFR